MAQLFINNFETTFIASVKDAPTTGTPETELDYGVLRISDGAAGQLLNPAGGDYYVLTAFKRSGTVESDIEIMRVTSVDNSVPGECRITVLRAQEGTTAKAYVAGDRLALRLTAGATNNWVQGDDARLTNSRTPTGPAGGVLSGTYPNPGFAVDMATQAELDAHTGAASNAHAASAISNAPAGNISATTVQAAINELDTEKEPNISAGTTAQYWRGDKTWQTLNTAAVAESTNLYYTDARVRAAVLTGYAAGANTAIAATDTVLQAFGKAQGQIDARQPTLVSGTNIRTVNGNSLLGSGNVAVGDVTGPASSVSGNVASFNGTTGKVLQDSGKALPAGAIVGTTDTQTLTNKTIDLASNTVSGTVAQFNAALSDGDFATLAGSETLTNKTLTDPKLLLGGTNGTAGQVPVSQGAGLPPAWSSALSGITLNDGYTEEVYAVTGTTPALSPTNGSIQTWTLSGNSTPTAGTWASGQSITLMIDDGTAFTINWSSLGVVWKTNGGSAPTLNTSGYTAIQLWKVGTTIYGARVGDA